MKTAVEWFNEQIKLNAEFREIYKGRVSFIIGLSKSDELFKKAKEMEKEQIVDAWNIRAKIDGVLTHTDNRSAQQYYNETFKSE